MQNITELKCRIIPNGVEFITRNGNSEAGKAYFGSKATGCLETT